MYENVSGMTRTRTISTVGRMMGPSSRPTRIYRTQRNSGLVAPGNYQLEQVGLGFSLNPLNWIKSAVGAVKGVLSNSTVTLPTTAGGATINAKDLGAIIRGSTVQVAGTAPTPGAMEQLNQGVERIPGGWLTVAGVGLGGILLATMLSRRGR
jgi:hypothetical protein